MMDRTPTKVLANGAIRYGVYDEAGNFLRYEYIKPEDEPTQEGTPINKATLLKVATAAQYGLGASAVPDDVFNVVGNWPRVDVGSYIGTGTYGVSNKNRITFPFAPYLVAISTLSSLGYHYSFVAMRGITQLNLIGNVNGVSTYGITLTWGDNYVEWYCGSATYQLNVEGTTYNYVAIGKKV